MVFMGTAVVYDRAKAIITSTGMTTEFGKIAGMLQEVKVERTPLQMNLDKVGKRIAIIGLILCLILAVLGAFRGHEIPEMFVWGIALAVAAVPGALPAVVVISLAFGVRRMAKRNALIRSLPAVETLGCTTVICTDKTGTMPQDQMTVKRIYSSGEIYEVSGTGYNPQGDFSQGGKTCEITKNTGLFKNKWLNLAILWETVLLIIIVCTPFLQQSFHTFALSAIDWLLVILVAGTIFPVLEVTKIFSRRFFPLNWSPFTCPLLIKDKFCWIN